MDSAENNVAFWISIPERYTRGDYSLLAGLGFGENKHVVWIIAAILVGSAIGLIALIVGLMVYANRTSSPTPNQAPKTTSPPLPPTNR